jgi:predicted RNA methylase
MNDDFSPQEQDEYLDASELPYHYAMLRDEARLIPFRKAIEACCRDKIVLESGTGTGILSLYAARAGARHVYATEIDPEVAAVARRNFERSGFDNITLLEKDSIELTPDDLNGQRAEVIIAENLSTWHVTEPQLLILNHFNEQLAAPGAVRLPQRVRNLAALAYTPYRFDDLVELRTFYHEYSGITPVSLFSKPALFHEVDAAAIQPESFDRTISLTANRFGIVNCLKLTSPVQVYRDLTFESTNTLMPPVIFPLPKDRKIQAGEVIEVRIRYRICTGWEEVELDA